MSIENNTNTTTVESEDKTNSMRWEDLDSGTVKKELANLQDSITAFGAEMEQLKNASTRDKAEKLLGILRDRDLSSSSWIASFVNENASAFPGLGGGTAKGAQKPDFYFALLPDKRKKYDEIQDYVNDAMRIHRLFKPLADIIREMPLQEIFVTYAIKPRMLYKKWDLNQYQMINKDVDSVNKLLTAGWATFESVAVSSQKYYNEHSSMMDSPDVREKYFKLRMDDYSITFRKYLTSTTDFFYVGDGKFTCEYNLATCMKVLDKYMGKVIELKGLDEKLNKLIANVDDLTDIVIMMRPGFRTETGGDLHMAVLNFLTTIKNSFKSSLEEFNKFKNGSSEAPYCFMTCPEAATHAAGYFGFEPGWSNSWDNGTHYYEIYRKILWAVTIQCREFAYVHGKVKK